MSKHYGNLEIYGYLTVGKNLSGEYTFPLVIGNEGEFLVVENNQLVFKNLQGSSAGIQGRLSLNDTDTIYTVNHPTIDPNLEFPVVSLDIPNSTSNIYVQGIFDRTPNSFRVVIGGTPSSSYGILWHISTQETTTIEISGGFTPIAGSGISISPSGADYVFSVEDNKFLETAGGTITGQLTVENDIVIDNGNLHVNDVIFTTGNFENVDANTILDQIPITNANAAFWDILIHDGTNFRASRVSAIWNGSGTIRYNEHSTESIGETSGINMIVNLNGSNVRLKSQVSSGLWNIKYIRKLL